MHGKPFFHVIATGEMERTDTFSRRLMVYSDGSKLQNKATGAGFIIYQANTIALQRSFSFGKESEIYDAEAKAALEMPTNRLASDLWIRLDNLEVATRLLSRPKSGSSQDVFLCFARARVRKISCEFKYSR